RGQCSSRPSPVPRPTPHALVRGVSVGAGVGVGVGSGFAGVRTCWQASSVQAAARNTARNGESDLGDMAGPPGADVTWFVMRGAPVVRRRDSNPNSVSS